MLVLALAIVLMLIGLAIQIDPVIHGAILSAWAAFTAWWLPGWEKLFTSNFVVDLIRSAIVALVILGLGEMYRRIPKSLDMRHARRFWGEQLIGDGIALSFGSLLDSRLLAPPDPPAFRFIKLFRDGRRLELAGPSEKIIGLCEVRAGSYFINVLAKYRHTPLPIEDDQTCLKRLNRSIISIGSSMSNEITEIIEHDSRNLFFQIEVQNNEGVIKYKATDSVVTFQVSEIRKDHGIILKITNQRFPGQFFFVCAGLGEWGTSGAAWYLAEHWKRLDELGEEFGCVVEVEIGSDQSARVVYQATRTNRSMVQPSA